MRAGSVAAVGAAAGAACGTVIVNSRRHLGRRWLLRPPRLRRTGISPALKPGPAALRRQRKVRPAGSAVAAGDGAGEAATAMACRWASLRAARARAACHPVPNLNQARRPTMGLPESSCPRHRTISRIPASCRSAKRAPMARADDEGGDAGAAADGDATAMAHRWAMALHSTASRTRRRTLACRPMPGRVMSSPIMTGPTRAVTSLQDHPGNRATRLRARPVESGGAVVAAAAAAIVLGKAASRDRVPAAARRSRVRSPRRGQVPQRRPRVLHRTPPLLRRRLR